MAPAHDDDIEAAAVEIDAIDVGDFPVPARRGFEASGDVEHLVVVEIEPGDGVARLGCLGFSSRLITARPVHRIRRRHSVPGQARDRRTPWRRRFASMPPEALPNS